MNSIDPFWLKLFENKDPLFYESHTFRKALPEIFHDPAQHNIANVLWIPRGLRWENPDVDNLTDQTFAECQWKLDGKQIVAGADSPNSRYLNCRRSVLKIATNVSIRFVRRNGRPWNHGELCEDLLTDEYRRDHSASADDSRSQGNGSDFMRLLRKALGSRVKDEDFEMFRLRCEEGLRPLQINELYKDYTANCIRVKICLVKKAQLDVYLVQTEKLLTSNQGIVSHFP